MKVLNDFRCANGHFNEYFVDNLATHVTCRACGAKATKVRAVPNFTLPGNDPAGFPTAADKWVKKREEKMRAEKRQGHTAFGEPSS